MSPDVMLGVHHIFLFPNFLFFGYKLADSRELALLMQHKC